MSDDAAEFAPPRPWHRAVGYGVHLYTASGAIWAFLTAVAIYAGDYALALLWMTVAVVVDSTDGALARRADIHHTAPRVDGRRLDDIVDYLNYTFLPLLLIWHACWLPWPDFAWPAIPLAASLMAFSNTGAKDDDEGFFVGFPSYWNVFAFYTAMGFHRTGPYVVLAAILVLSVLSVLPLRFVYPSKAPRWRRTFVAGAVIWMVVCLVMLAMYPDVPAWLVWVSFIYPALYVALSTYLDVSVRRRSDAAPGPP